MIRKCICFGILYFNLYVYHVTRAFDATTLAFDDAATLAFDLLTRNFNFVTP